MSLITSRNITGGAEILGNPTLQHSGDMTSTPGWSLIGAGTHTRIVGGGISMINADIRHDLVATIKQPVIVRITFKTDAPTLSSFIFNRYNGDGIHGTNPFHTIPITAVEDGYSRVDILMPGLMHWFSVRNISPTYYLEVKSVEIGHLSGGTPTEQRLVSSVDKGTSWNSTGSNRILLPATSSLNLTNAFTIEGWVFANKNNTGTRIIFTKVGSNYQYQAELTGTSMLFYLAAGAASNTFYSVSRVVPIGQWFYFAARADVPSGKLALTINTAANTHLRTDLTGTHYTTTNPGYICDTSYPMLGFYSNMRYWNTYRSDVELMDNKDTYLVGDETGLVANYTFEDRNAANKCTTTGSANNGTVIGGSFVGFRHTSSSVKTQRFIENNTVSTKSFGLEGSKLSYIKAGFKTALHLNSFTVTFKTWLRDVVAGQTQQFFANIPQDNAPKHYGILVNTNGRFEGKITNSLGHASQVYGPLATRGTKYNVGLSWDGSYMRLYVNGVVYTSGLLSNASVGDYGAYDFLIGMMGFNFYEYPINGVMKDFAIWDTVLDATQIAAVHSKNLIEMNPSDKTNMVLGVAMQNDNTVVDVSTNSFTITPYKVHSNNLI